MVFSPVVESEKLEITEIIYCQTGFAVSFVLDLPNQGLWGPVIPILIQLACEKLFCLHQFHRYTLRNIPAYTTRAHAWWEWERTILAALS